MNKWLTESQEALSKALNIANRGSVPLYNIYMLAPIIYAERQKTNDDVLFYKMSHETDERVRSDWSIDEESKQHHKFHFVSSYLFCFVVAGKFDEFKYDEIMEYVNQEMDLFEN